MTVDLSDRLAGVLLGTAVGDALGLPMEGMTGRAIAKAYPTIDRYFLLGRVGFVSDDTEQSALVAQSLARSPRDLGRAAGGFRRSLFGWFLRMPWGIGMGTLKACLRIGIGLRRSGVSSAGNGAAMRAAIVGAFFHDEPERRRTWSDALARVTHVDVRAVQGARYVAELAAACISMPDVPRGELVAAASRAVDDPGLAAAVGNARRLARENASVATAASELGCTGFVLHTLAIATFSFLRFGHDARLAIVETIRAGGDTDSNAAIVGAWVGALHGAGGLPADLVNALHDGPFGPSHLRALALDLERSRGGEGQRGAAYFWPRALLRNVALFPVMLVHAFRVIFSRG